MNPTPSQLPMTPHVRSAVNGMIIPLLPHQGGILHRFHQPENRLVVAGTSEPEAESAKLVVEGEADPLLKQALQANEALEKQASEQAAQLQALQDQMAQMQQMFLQAKAPEPVPESAAPPAKARKGAAPVLAQTPVSEAPLSPPML